MTTSYSIKDLEKLSGIKAHTLRIWEQRYTILKPERTTTNIRTYNSSELKHILNISLLNRNGHKISKLAKLSHEEICSKVLEVSQKVSLADDRINDFLLAMLDLDRKKFESAFHSNVQSIGLEITIVDVLFPFLSRLKVMWQTGAITPAQEHFTTNLIRQKIIVAIDKVQANSVYTGPKYLLFLPEGELHEIALLFYTFLLNVRHREVIYLGQSVPLSDVESVYNLYQPENILCVVGNAHLQKSAYLQKLSDTFPLSDIYLSSVSEVPELKQPNIKNFRDPRHLLELIAGI